MTRAYGMQLAEGAWCPVELEVGVLEPTGIVSTELSVFSNPLQPALYSRGQISGAGLMEAAADTRSSSSASCGLAGPDRR